MCFSAYLCTHFLQAGSKMENSIVVLLRSGNSHGVEISLHATETENCSFTDMQLSNMQLLVSLRIVGMVHCELACGLSAEDQALSKPSSRTVYW